MAEQVSRSTMKKRSSIQVALEQVRDGKADAFFSAGNTAACWTIARMVLGTIEEVDRPALAAVFPSHQGCTVLLDVGANARCKARNLEEFAVMGSAYSRGVFHNPSPRVGLMSLGEEDSKGSELIRDVNEVLRMSSLNFVGNVEGHDLFTGKVDVCRSTQSGFQSLPCCHFRFCCVSPSGSCRPVTLAFISASSVFDYVPAPLARPLKQEARKK